MTTALRDHEASVPHSHLQPPGALQKAGMELQKALSPPGGSRCAWCLRAGECRALKGQQREGVEACGGSMGIQKRLLAVVGAGAVL
jgi:hypothetical protein